MGSSCQGEHLAAPAPRVCVSHVGMFCNSQLPGNADVSCRSQIPTSQPYSWSFTGEATLSHPDRNTCEPNRAASESSPGADNLAPLTPADMMGLVNHVGGSLRKQSRTKHFCYLCCSQCKGKSLLGQINLQRNANSLTSQRGELWCFGVRWISVSAAQTDVLGALCLCLGCFWWRCLHASREQGEGDWLCCGSTAR